MLIRKPVDLTENEVTDYSVYLQRREFIKTLWAGGCFAR